MNGTRPDDDPAPQVPVGLDEQIACVERELSFRRRLYPRWVKDKKLTKEAAADEERRMAGVLATLQRLQRGDEREHPELLQRGRQRSRA